MRIINTMQYAQQPGIGSCQRVRAFVAPEASFLWVSLLVASERLCVQQLLLFCTALMQLQHANSTCRPGRQRQKRVARSGDSPLNKRQTRNFKLGPEFEGSKLDVKVEPPSPQFQSSSFGSKKVGSSNVGPKLKVQVWAQT